MSPWKLNRREFMLSTVAGAAATLVRPRTLHADPAQKGRVIILGFDGVEPAIVQQMMDAGQLPNYKKLAETGAFRHLGSTIPPQSPTAWTSFTTCRNPGNHNIFDFIRRTARGPKGPVPAVGTGRLDPIQIGADGALIKPAEAIAYRKGPSFWSIADQQGAKCKILNVPFAYPADNMDHGLQLCALGVPDLRGTTSTFTFLSDKFTPEESQRNYSGGRAQAITFDAQDSASVRLPGPRDTRVKGSDSAGAYTETTIQVSVDRKARAGKIVSAGKTIEIAEGTWSPWLEVRFEMSPSVTVWGVLRVYPVEIGARVRIYTTCMQFHPQHPFAPLTEPNDYSNELFDRYGLFKTIGWSFDTHALRQDVLDEDAFWKDIESSMGWHEQLCLDELERGDFDLLTAVWTATDRVGHMYWRFRDPKHPLYDPELAKKYEKALEQSYIISDRIIGRAMEKLAENDLFMVLSDHGFESWRTGFNVNNWLEEQGYLKIANRQMATEPGFLLGIDWTQTKAYSVGLSSLYLNIKDRETAGIVAPGDTDALLAEIKDKLLQVTDPDTGMKVFTNIYTRDVYSGQAMADAPDISFGYNRFYQSSKTAAKGAMGVGLFEKNDDKWSGEHAASDPEWCPGIFFCNQKVEATDPNIMDLGVIALGYLGKSAPADFEGRNLLKA
ncbi:MAG: alkaline phosphatase family protein [Candidatus Hydrogenedentes bacterium]|nr:alkaline phosphatase family protein [Candidatus Hydrogenedentota bacterium]